MKNSIIDHQEEHDALIAREWEMVIESPWYYYTTYWKVDGKQATTRLSEQEFNARFFEAERIRLDK